MFTIEETDKGLNCPPITPAGEPLCGGRFCTDCREMFNRLPVEQRAAAMIKDWWKNQRKVTYYHATDEMAQSWGVSMAKDSMVGEQDEAFYDGWALFIELGRRMIVIGKRVEI